LLLRKQEESHGDRQGFAFGGSNEDHAAMEYVVSTSSISKGHCSTTWICGPVDRHYLYIVCLIWRREACVLRWPERTPSSRLLTTPRLSTQDYLQLKWRSLSRLRGPGDPVP